MPSNPSKREKKTGPEYATMDQISPMTTQRDHAAQEQTKVLQATILPTGPTQAEIKKELNIQLTSMTETNTEPAPSRTYNND